ncbi:hypothetical protein SeMB42_g00692 [Synchytrium endobioticum]|uniref:FAS1 domain-containing protein n=1 Tax=Synchytrium endobioticum TaxID=286115 RepID=A0A507DRL6_9FUNG|nr:hypothetical protein SeMB42_g00692 [Synchytrium endobioticum]
MKVSVSAIGAFALLTPLVSGQTIMDIFNTYSHVGSGKSYTLANITDALKADPAALALVNQGGSTFFAPIDSSYIPAVGGLGAAATPNYLHAALSYHTLLSQLYNPGGSAQAYALLETALKAPISSQYVNLPNGGQKIVALKGQPTKLKYGQPSQAVILETIVASNGIVNVIDQFLLVPPAVSASASTFGATQFVKYLGQANMTSMVDGLSGVTVLVPQDNAFQAIASTLAGYSTQQLQTLLQSHIIKQTVFSTNIVGGAALTTFGGPSVSLSGTGGLTATGDNVTATVVNSDVTVAGGAMHVIDTQIEHLSRRRVLGVS